MYGFDFLQVPCLHFNIHVKICPSRLCMKKTNSKMKKTLKIKATSKMKTTSKIGLPPKSFCPLPLKSYLKFFWWLLTWTAKRQLMSNRICYHVSKPEIDFHMIGIINAALPMQAQTEKTTFSCKDDQGKSWHVYWSGGKGLVKNQNCTRPRLTQP